MQWDSTEADCTQAITFNKEINPSILRKSQYISHL